LLGFRPLAGITGLRTGRGVYFSGRLA